MDNEENKQNIPTRQIILDQEEGEIMWPSPSAEQDLLWDELYNAVSEQDLLRETKWFSVPDIIRKYLSSKEIADKIKKISGKFNLNDYQTSELAKNIKYVFIKELLLADFIVKISEELKIDKNLANQIGQDVKNEIFVPQKEYLLKLYPPSNVSSARDAISGRSKVMEGKPIVSFKAPIFKKEAEIKSSYDKVSEVKQEVIMSKVKNETVIKKEEPLVKFKVVPDTPTHLSQGVSLDHLYEKLKSTKEERKEFLEEVVAKKEEELPKAWQMTPLIQKEEQKNKSMGAQLVKSKEIIQKPSDTISSRETADGRGKTIDGKPPIRTMKGDITKIQK